MQLPIAAMQAASVEVLHLVEALGVASAAEGELHHRLAEAAQAPTATSDIVRALHNKYREEKAHILSGQKKYRT